MAPFWKTTAALISRFPSVADADDGQDIQVGRVADQLEQCLFCAIEQRLLGEEVEAGIAGDGQFRESDDLHAFFRCLPHQSFYFFYIIKTIRYLYKRYGGGNFYKSVVHICLYLSYSFLSLSGF